MYICVSVYVYVYTCIIIYIYVSCSGFSGPVSSYVRLFSSKTLYSKKTKKKNLQRQLVGGASSILNYE